MNKIKLFITATFVANMLVAQTTIHDEKDMTGTLQVLVRGFKNTDGQLMLALSNSAGNFIAKKPYKGIITKVSANEELIKFDNIPYGDYAVAVIHDMNEGSKLDNNAFGIPTEGYGFSNNVMGKYGPPEWIQASFVFSGGDQPRVIDL